MANTTTYQEIKILPELFDLDVKQDDQDGVMGQLVDLLESRGFILDSYREKIFQREREYPTGLCFPDIVVAIPHSDSDCVIESAIAVGRCKTPVSFHDMEDPDNTVEVNLVVMLAIKEPKNHVTVLNNLMGAFTDRDTCEVLLTSSDTQTVCDVFRKIFTRKGED